MNIYECNLFCEKFVYFRSDFRVVSVDYLQYCIAKSAFTSIGKRQMAQRAFPKMVYQPQGYRVLAIQSGKRGCKNHFEDYYPKINLPLICENANGLLRSCARGPCQNVYQSAFLFVPNTVLYIQWHSIHTPPKKAILLFYTLCEYSARIISYFEG